MAVTIVPTSAYRILFLKDEQMTPRVARNPTCAIQQSAWAVCSAAWLKHPISFSGVDVQKNKGVEVLHFFFVLAQVGYIVTIIALWQRRSILVATGYHPTFSAFTFPFTNTAITTCLYRKTFPKMGVWLDLLVFYHVIIAFVFYGAFTAMYVGKGLFMFPAAIPPTSQPKNFSAVQIENSMDDDDNNYNQDVDDNVEATFEGDLDASELTPCVDIETI